MRNISIQEEKGIFSKKVPQQKFAVELAMSKAGYQFCQTSSVFQTPKVRHQSPANNQIDFEFIAGITLREHLVSETKIYTSQQSESQLIELFTSLGKGLAELHQSDAFETVEKRGFPSTLEIPQHHEKVYLHGDFTLRNIMWFEDKPWIIDWSISPIFTNPVNHGSRYWDISFFLSSLFYFSFTTFFTGKTKNKLASAFLQAYYTEAGVQEVEFKKELRAFIQTHNYYELYQELNSKKSFINRLLDKHAKKKLLQFVVGQFTL